MNRLFLKPAPGLLVRDPRSKLPLPEAGAHKPDTTYWRRRLRSGDAIEVSPPSATVDLGGGAALTFAGTVTEGGVIEILVGTESIAVPVAEGDTADDIASRINEAAPMTIAAPGSPENG